MGPETNLDSLPLGAQGLSRLFPFHIALARDLSIVGVGPALGRCLSISPQARQPFASVFSVARPEIEILSFEHLAGLTETVVVLRSPQGLHLQGQFERLGNDALLFACSPMVEDLTALQRIGLTLRDFAPHDPSCDYLLLMQSTKMNLLELQRATEDLRHQRAELRATKERLESALRESHLAAERLEDARQQMAEAKALAESANQAKSDFIASMSHEMRTPMHVLLGMIDLLQETAPSAEQRELMRVMGSNASMLRHLVGDLLDLATIEQGCIQLDSGPLAPAQLVEDVCALAVHLAKGKAIDIVRHVEPTVPQLVEGDEMRVRQVLVNLVTNAVKFTNQGTVTVGVSFEITDRHHGVIGFKVSDTGVGISAVGQSRLFQRFQRAGGTAQVGGTGLGLFISRSLVELMGGEIAVSSQEGAGATFRVTVPCRVLARGDEQPLEVTTPSARGAQKRAARILLVEDYPSSQQFARQVLRGEGHEVDLVATGAGALAATARCRYDLVIMDIHLPDFSGLEAARRIRAAEPERGDESVPIVAMTAHAVHGIHQQCSDAGMAACATKPLSAHDLRSLVSQWADPRATVIVADDYRVVQELARRQLSALGVRTAIASNGHDVMVQLRRQPVALLVMDLMMPEMDGVATMRAIRSRPGFASLPIVILSGTEDDERRRHVGALGCAEFLVKPVARDRLLQVVSGLIERPPPAMAMAQPPIDEAGGLSDLIPEYLAKSRASVAKARASLSAGNLAEVESVGHNLKGTGQSFGFEAITDLGRELERAAVACDTSRAAASLAELESVLSKIPGVCG